MSLGTGQWLGGQDIHVSREIPAQIPDVLDLDLELELASQVILSYQL